jgi:hypothetical protein
MPLHGVLEYIPQSAKRYSIVKDAPHAGRCGAFRLSKEKNEFHVCAQDVACVNGCRPIAAICIPVAYECDLRLNLMQLA